MQNKMWRKKFEKSKRRRKEIAIIIIRNDLSEWKIKEENVKAFFWRLYKYKYSLQLWEM